MPEMAIGLFPDVGATYFLSRLKAGSCVGRFLATTGTTLRAWDCLRAGVGTHFVAAARLPKLKKALTTRFTAQLVGAEALRLCEEILSEFVAEPPAADSILVQENVEVIDRCGPL